MGANASTAVPLYASGQVLDAARLNLTNAGVPVFSGTATRDAAFGGSGEKVLAEGQLCYLEDANVVQYYDGASFATVGPTTAGGLVLIATATPTAVADVSVNNCFTSTYENYRIVFAATAVTGTGNLSIRLRVGGVDTSTNYLGQRTEMFTTTLSTDSNPLGTDEWICGRIETVVVGTSFAIDVFRPQTAQKTAFIGLHTNQQATEGNVMNIFSGIQTASTQFDGFTLRTTGTNFTGTLRVYGYANS